MQTLIQAILPSERAAFFSQLVAIPPALEAGDNENVSRAQLAFALSLLLFDELLDNVPDALLYAEDQLAKGEHILLDHGALRTVAVSMQKLPSGQQAFARILEPLGYQMVGTYPLDKLKMCGFVYCHQDDPENIAQYFVSELYPERFSDDFQDTVRSLVETSRDPLSDPDKGLLSKLSTIGHLSLEEGTRLLPVLASCFARQHDNPSLSQYQTLKSESAEMAWIATEGNVFNHATDRVADLDTLEAEQRAKGRPMKPQIEVGQNANIRQTAYRAATVKRSFSSHDGRLELDVPGSFFEFIERGMINDEITGQPAMDLRFDSRNAQGIFTMTRAQKAP